LCEWKEDLRLRRGGGVGRRGRGRWTRCYWAAGIRWAGKRARRSQGEEGKCRFAGFRIGSAGKGTFFGLCPSSRGSRKGIKKVLRLFWLCDSVGNFPIRI
jgi:hypothetical protein